MLADFHQSTLDEAGVSSPEFGNLITRFKAKYFPLPPALEAAWARGDAGLDWRDRWLGALLRTMRQPIRDGELPGDFVLGEMLRLVPVSGPEEAPPMEAVPRGTLAGATSLTTLARAQAQFCSEFSQSEQPLARTLAAYLKPTCAARHAAHAGTARPHVHQLAVVNHYDAGQIVVHRGDMIDVKDKVALDLLNEKLMPVELKFQMAVEADRAQKQSQQDHDAVSREHDAAVNLQRQALRTSSVNEWLAAGWPRWRCSRCWRSGNGASSAGAPRRSPWPRTSGQAPASDIAHHLAQAVKEALLQELAAQRGELLKAQQDAAN